MPTSNPDTRPITLGIVDELAPRSVIDVCCGAGDYGVLLREKLGPTARIDAVEIWWPYIKKRQLETYSNVYVTEALRFLGETTVRYDLALLIGSLEHFAKSDGVRLLGRITERAEHAVVVTPRGLHHQGPAKGNPYEEHVSGWTEEDFVDGWTIIEHKRAVVARA